MTVWVLGSLAYAALLVLLLARPLAVADAVEAPVDEPVSAVRGS